MVGARFEIMGWVTDFFRLIGGFLFWNARKTLYRLRGMRGPCPCQHPSDSGGAWETRCDAIVHWRRAARFRRVCPLLLKDPEGRWRCSVNAADVRALWGRVFVFYGGGLAILYLVSTLTVFVALRTAGYQVTYAGVVWPPAWGKFDAVKSEFFYAKFQRAYAVQDIREALLDLSIAYDLNPQNYDAGFQLAQLSQMGQPALANRVYVRLLATHPARAEQTAQAFFHALLARGDFKAVQALAHNRILCAPDSSYVWLNAFLFANQRTGDAEALSLLIEEVRTGQFPADARTVLTLVAALRTIAPEDARRLLTGAGHGVTGYAFYFICRQLIARGFSEAALDLLDQPNTGLNVGDCTSLRLGALAAQGRTATLNREVDFLLSPPLTDPVVELLGTHLIRWPDAGLFEKLSNRLKQSSLTSDQEGYTAYLVFFCAAGVGKSESDLAWSATRLRQILGARLVSLDATGKFFLGRKTAGYFENYLSALQPLPLETIYALLDHYSPNFPQDLTP